MGYKLVCKSSGQTAELARAVTFAVRKRVPQSIRRQQFTAQEQNFACKKLSGLLKKCEWIFGLAVVGGRDWLGGNAGAVLVE
jgi:hypothetical protein